MDFWRKKLRTRAGDFDSRCMWLTAACLSACLLRSGALRVIPSGLSFDTLARALHRLPAAACAGQHGWDRRCRHVRNSGAWYDMLLEVGVQPLVRIEPRSGSRFRTVGWQVEDLDLRLVLGQPLTHHR